MRWFERDPLLDPIRQDSRVIAFMRELRSSWENTRAKYGTTLSETTPRCVAEAVASRPRYGYHSHIEDLRCGARTSPTFATA